MEIVRTIKYQVPSGYWYKEVNHKVGKCDICGSEVELLTHTNQCQCGQRYNPSGQMVNKTILG